MLAFCFVYSSNHNDGKTNIINDIIGSCLYLLGDYRKGVNYGRVYRQANNTR